MLLDAGSDFPAAAGSCIAAEGEEEDADFVDDAEAAPAAAAAASAAAAWPNAHAGSGVAAAPAAPPPSAPRAARKTAAELIKEDGNSSVGESKRKRLVGNANWHHRRNEGGSNTDFANLYVAVKAAVAARKQAQKERRLPERVPFTEIEDWLLMEGLSKYGVGA